MDHNRLAVLYLSSKRLKTAGEVRFVKDRGGDEKNWGWSTPGPSERQISPEFAFDSRNLKPLAATLRSALIAMGHVQNAYNTFTKIKSATVSPDGSLGGKGYIQKITDIRRQFMNCSEALSSVTDTLYDELHSPHWNPAIEDQSVREREDVVEIMDDVNEIRKDPEEWAEESEENPPKKSMKTASSIEEESFYSFVIRPYGVATSGGVFVGNTYGKEGEATNFPEALSKARHLLHGPIDHVEILDGYDGSVVRVVTRHGIMNPSQFYHTTQRLYRNVAARYLERLNNG